MWLFEIYRQIGWNVGWSWPLPTFGETNKMLITVTRTNKTTDGIFGNLSLDMAPFKCFTEENLALCIPAGTYDVLFMWSKNFQQIMPHVLVPGRTAIEVHWANFPNQLEGCLALGTAAEVASDCIDQSKAAWISFVQIALTDEPVIKIKYVEDYGA